MAKKPVHVAMWHCSHKHRYGEEEEEEEVTYHSFRAVLGNKKLEEHGSFHCFLHGRSILLVPQKKKFISPR